MHDHPSPATSATSGGPAFDERLSVPWWWYVPVVGLGVLLGAEVHMGYPGVRSWIGYVVFVPLLVGALLAMSRTHVRVQGGELQVGKARVPLRFVGRVEVVDRRDKQIALGPELNPAAFVLHRGWVGPLARVEVTGPDDLTPYWVFSVREPDRLLSVLEREAGPDRRS